MTSVEIYIKIGNEFRRIDLFKDEKISLTSSVQNINDLSKVFTDYTQSFTIPASKNNNLIFNYWNESGVNDGFDQRIRYDAIIELNTIPFKKGKIQIEKANEKNNRLESYSITFYGNVKQIKDLFKEEKLSILDYSSLNHPYTATKVINRINGTTTDGVYYPLIGNQHRYTFGDGGTNDITIGGTPLQSIVYTDLFPAIPVSKVFEFIQNRYNINFTSSLFSTSYWSELYLYGKNKEQQNVYTAPVKVNFTSLSYTNFPTQPFTDLNLTTDLLFINPKVNNPLYPSHTSLQFVNVYSADYYLKINVSNTSVNYRLKVKKSDGTIFQIFDNLIGNTTNYFQFNFNFNESFYFEVESEIPFTFDTELYLTQVVNGEYYSSGSYIYGLYYISHNYISSSQSTTSDINIADYIPDMKVLDFFNGIIKLFNLTITATNENTFNLEPLEFYYSYGKYIDINNYVINDSTDLERTKLFKKLSFNHEQSSNILNNYFRNTFNRGWDYGDLIWEDNLSNESNTYEIKSPFENVMYDRTIGTNFITTSLIDKDLKPYKPKPILMYKNGLETLTGDSIKIYTGTSYVITLDYQRFSNELFINGDIASLNFGADNSSWLPSLTTNNSLFYLWYRNYISAIYDIRCRIVKLKAIIPIPKLSDIKLNDKIIYKDKKYIINTYTTDLTTGEVDLELISDFREVASTTTGNGRFALKQIFNIDNTAQDLEITILKLNAEYYDVTNIDTGYSSPDNYSDGTFIVPISHNTTGDIAFKQIEITYHNPDIKQYINIIQNA
jgi:hypothetical protein